MKNKSLVSVKPTCYHLSLWNTFVSPPLLSCLLGAWVYVSLRILCPPRCRCGLCSSVCCWVPAPCWWRRRASPCSECACSTTPWCSAASLSFSKHTGLCFVYAVFVFCLSWFMWQRSAERAHSYSAMLEFIFTQLDSHLGAAHCNRRQFVLETKIVIFLKLCAQIAGIRGNLYAYLFL